MTDKHEIQKLQSLLDSEEDFSKKLEIHNKIHKIKMKVSGIKPTNSEIDCVGCGA